MIRCSTCPHETFCRVPRDMMRFQRVCQRMESQGRTGPLQQRLRYYVEHKECLVSEGVVDL